MPAEVEVGQLNGRRTADVAIGMLVSECLVVQRDEKLVGLVYPDQEQVKKLRLSQEDIENIMEQNRKEINPNLPSYAQLFSIQVMEQEFEKTPKKSIKRFLYT